MGNRDMNYGGQRLEEEGKVQEWNKGHESGFAWCAPTERIAELYLSVPCEHILKKHKSTDLEHVMTKQLVNSKAHVATSMKTDGDKKFD